MDCALSVADWSIIHYLFDHWPKGCAKRGVERAIMRGNLEMVKWLYANGFKHYAEPMDDTAESGHLDILLWLKDNIKEDPT